MEQSSKILALLSESAVRTNFGISLQKNQHNHLSQREHGFSDGEKMLYFQKEKLMLENFIGGAIASIESILLLNGEEIGKNSNIYELWMLLKDDEKALIANETFKKYREMHEYRTNLRRPSIEITEMVDYLTETGIENQLRTYINSNQKKDSNKMSLAPDTDFFSKFSIGLIRHFFDNYVYKGKINDIQKNKACYEIFGALRSIIDADDDKFKKMMSKYRIWIDDTYRL